MKQSVNNSYRKQMFDIITHQLGIIFDGYMRTEIKRCKVVVS